MCRLALIISKIPVNRFETAFKSAWADGNDDGVGIYWRDMEGTRHLARFPKSADLAKVGTTYDRMLIHFRKSTKGEGTHPFTCKDRPKLDSRNWLLVHNGCVADGEARKELEKTHTFSTEIDSEIFIHIWGEIKEKDLAKRAKKFSEAREKLGITGWANLIFYNVISDEWVAFSDGSIGFVYNKDTLIICSDDTWFDTIEATKRKIHNLVLATGDIAYGKGLKYKVKEGVWKIRSAIPTTSASLTNVDGRALYRGCGMDADVWEPAYDKPTQRKEAGWDATERSFVDTKGNALNWDASKRAFVDAKGYPVDSNYTQYGNPNGHYFTPSEFTDQNNDEYCDICFMTREYHTLKPALDNDGDDGDEDARERETAEIDSIANSRIDESVWNRPHPFTRNFNKGTITCMCGSTVSYGTLHLAHEFKPIIAKNGKPTSYCFVCGNMKTMGNHKEENSETHFFTPLRFEVNQSNGSTTYIDSPICGRCGFRNEVHPMSYNVQIKQSTQSSETMRVERMRPMGCGCKPDERPQPIICTYHWGQGFRDADNQGYLVKKIAFDSGAE